jgi:hypothetical protein
MAQAEGHCRLARAQRQQRSVMDVEIGKGAAQHG